MTATADRVAALAPFFRITSTGALAHAANAGWYKTRIKCRRCKYAWSSPKVTYWDGPMPHAEIPPASYETLLAHARSHPENKLP